jgi:hypothetical protein
MEHGLSDTQVRGHLISKGFVQAEQFSWTKTAEAVAAVINQQT